MSHHAPRPPLPISCPAPCPSQSFMGDTAYEPTVELDPPDEPKAPARPRLPSEEVTMV